jgi:hypothetical protein
MHSLPPTIADVSTSAAGEQGKGKSVMILGKLSAGVMTGALLSCVGWGVASAQAPGNTPAVPGRVYTLHTAAVGGCPSLDWHIVVGANNTLSGMIGADDMKTVFRVSGTYDPNLKTFRLDGQEVGGTRTGAVNGAFQPETFNMAASLGGLPVGSACQGKTVYVKWLEPDMAGVR